MFLQGLAILRVEKKLEGANLSIAELNLLVTDKDSRMLVTIKQHEAILVGWDTTVGVQGMLVGQACSVILS